MPDDYRIALRPDDSGQLDDTVVKGVSMFRAEIMDNNTLWMCCYLEGSDERITFCVRGKNLRYDVTEHPHGDFPYEKGSICV